MSITHIIVGHEAAKQLQMAIALDESLAGNIIVLRDTLGIGQIYSDQDNSFVEIRTNFWKSLSSNWNDESIVDDEKNIQEYIDNVNPEEDIAWFWMAPCVSDVMAYFWLLQYFKKVAGVLHTLFINSLPFFNEKGTLFYPKNFSEVLPREMVKCKKLVKDVSPADFEIDGDEWIRLSGENAMVRSHDGGKKITSRNENHYDGLILNQFQFAKGNIKASKVISQALSKNSDTVSDLFITKRLYTLIEEGKLVANGDITKPLNQWDVNTKAEKQNVENQEY
jgi:hypothetical protein